MLTCQKTNYKRSTSKEKLTKHINKVIDIVSVAVIIGIITTIIIIPITQIKDNTKK
jgi:type II secretory pathway component PulF